MLDIKGDEGMKIILVPFLCVEVGASLRRKKHLRLLGRVNKSNCHYVKSPTRVSWTQW